LKRQVRLALSSFQRDRASGARIDARAAINAFIRVDNSDVVEGNSFAGARIYASAATDARIFINNCRHGFSPNFVQWEQLCEQSVNHDGKTIFDKSADQARGSRAGVSEKPDRKSAKKY
jgi:hypothetical protein